jgi:CubicO group peptidase (beta-lactamase class C family)
MKFEFDSERFTKIIEKQTSPEPFSGVVYLTRGDEVLYKNGFGYAVRSERIPNQSNTRFQMASGCKIFTSVAISQLVEQGKLTFESLLSDCIDVKFPHYAPDISIQHLLTHCSGIKSYFEEDINPDYEALWQDVPQYKIRSPKDFLPLFQHKTMKFSPGEKFDYNDGGYILLGLVIENISGKSFDEFVQKNVFDPAGMKDSGYFATDQLPERSAYAYIQNPDGSWRTNFFAVPITGAPDGGAYTTAPDMHQFWKALKDKKLLNAELTERLLSSQITTSWEDPHSDYGFGVWVDKTDEWVRKFFVEGYDPGVALRSCVYPKEGKVLTVIGNTAEALWPLYSQLEEFLGLI